MRYTTGMLVLTGALLAGCAAAPSDAVPRSRGIHDEFRPAGPLPVVPNLAEIERPDPAVTEAAASERSNAIGQTAPDFTLPDQDEKPLRLSDLRGQWVVLYFYPADDTPGCTCQATEFTQLLQNFRAAGARILGVSPDNPFIHRRFIRKYRLQIPLLSDPKKNVMREYGAWVDIPRGLAAPGTVIRSTYLIDPSGTVAWHWPEVIPQGHAERVMNKLTELRDAASPPAAAANGSP